MIRKNDLTDETLDALWEVFGWSMNVLLSGILPERDWSGNEVPSGGRHVAEGWRGSLIQIRGDWEFLCSVFRFPYWNAAGNMCWMCSATNAVGPSPLDSCWRQGGLACHQADARSLRVSSLSKASASPVQRGHRFAAVVRHGRRVALHEPWDHGARRGQCLHAMHQEAAWRATTHAENCERLDDEIRAWYRQKGEKSKLQGKLTLARLRSSSGYPKLKEKGAATRHMASFTLELAARHCAGPSDRCVLGVVQTLAEIYHILEEEGMFLSDAAKTRLPELARQFHLLYNRLSREALAEVPVVKEWKMSPKMHLFIHLMEWQVTEIGLNPRGYGTYADEDLVGTMVEVSRSCHPSTLAPVPLTKWLLLALHEE